MLSCLSSVAECYWRVFSEVLREVSYVLSSASYERRTNTIVMIVVIGTSQAGLCTVVLKYRPEALAGILFFGACGGVNSLFSGHSTLSWRALYPGETYYCSALSGGGRCSPREFSEPSRRKIGKFEMSPSWIFWEGYLSALSRGEPSTLTGHHG